MTQAIKSPQLREGVRAKFIDKWALRYVEKIKEVGKKEALDWGTQFFNPLDAPAIAARTKEILKGKGLL